MERGRKARAFVCQVPAYRRDKKSPASQRGIVSVVSRFSRYIFLFQRGP